MKTAMQELIEWVRKELPMDLDYPRMIESKATGLLDKEKEQIKDAYNEGYRDAELDVGSCWSDDDVADHENAQIYYDETFITNSKTNQ